MNDEVIDTSAPPVRKAGRFPPATRKVPEMKILLVVAGVWLSSAVLFVLALAIAAARTVSTVDPVKVTEPHSETQAGQGKTSWRARRRARRENVGEPALTGRRDAASQLA